MFKTEHSSEKGPLALTYGGIAQREAGEGSTIKLAHL